MEKDQGLLAKNQYLKRFIMASLRTDKVMVEHIQG
jgi:hypothetical protein